MIQYKRLIQADEEGKLCYRPTDKSYKEEIERMKDFEKLFSRDKSISDLSAYRLHQDPFYFKLCPAGIFDPTSIDMIHGMYIPLDYWQVLLNSPSILGKRGGKILTFDNVERYINNTFFINLVYEGWIGSKAIRTDVLSDIIQTSLEKNKAVILAALSIVEQTKYDENNK